MDSRATDIKERVDIRTALKWRGVEWNGRGEANCPVCGHKALKVEKDNPGVYYCHGCKKGGTVIDFVMAAENFATPGEAMKYIEDRIGTRRGAAVKTTAAAAAAPQPGANPEPPPSSNIEHWRSAYKDSDGERYLTGRGISAATAERFNIGYNAKERRVTIPTDTGYNARAIDAGREPKYKGNSGTRGFFPSNWRDMITHSEQEPERYPPAPVFVTEGELNALSVMDAAGYDGELNLLGAVAMGGTESAAKLGENIVAVKKSGAALRTFILIPDKDAPTETAPEGVGVKAMRTLAAKLRDAGVDYCFWGDDGAAGRFDVLGGAADANDALVKDRAQFHSALHAAAADAPGEIDRKREATRSAYLAKAAGSASSMADFDAYLARRADAPHITTGIDELDDLLGGGLDERLYIIAAASSCGKTSFCLQMAEHISATGTDVLFFAFEMGRHELKAKGISRRTYLNAHRTNPDGSVVVDRADIYNKVTTAQTILDSVKNPPNKDLAASIAQARADYQRDAANLYLTEVGVDDDGEKPTAAFIGQTIEQHIIDTGRPPVVIIDYVQLIEPADHRATAKQNMDDTSLLLRQIVRRYHIPIIAISSISRGAYYKPIEKESLKESGDLEFTADVIIGIQARGLLLKNAQSNGRDDERDGKEAVQSATEDDVNFVELVISKNRGGLTSGVKRTKEADGATTYELRNVLNLDFEKRYSHFAPGSDEGQRVTKPPRQPKPQRGAAAPPDAAAAAVAPPATRTPSPEYADADTHQLKLDGI